MKDSKSREEMAAILWEQPYRPAWRVLFVDLALCLALGLIGIFWGLGIDDGPRADGGLRQWVAALIWSAFVVVSARAGWIMAQRLGIPKRVILSEQSLRVPFRPLPRKRNSSSDGTREIALAVDENSNLTSIPLHTIHHVALSGWPDQYLHVWHQGGSVTLSGAWFARPNALVELEAALSARILQATSADVAPPPEKLIAIWREVWQSARSPCPRSTPGGNIHERSNPPDNPSAEDARNRGAWVIFAHGTCVFFTTPPKQLEDLTAEAYKLLEQYGPVAPGAGTSDFSVFQPDGVTGWIVTSQHPDLLTFVFPEEVLGLSEFAMGVHGRRKRAVDAANPKMIHHECYYSEWSGFIRWGQGGAYD